jgi:phage baseplate assembly protein W
MATYIGFSTYNRDRKFTLTDFELVRQDLLNHFAIRKGEKIMNPAFGTIIWDTLFEPLDETTRNLISEDIQQIVNYDPRIGIDNIAITEYEHGIQLELELRFILTNQTDLLRIKFDRESGLTLI